MSLVFEGIKFLWNSLVDSCSNIISLLVTIVPIILSILSVPTFFGMTFWQVIKIIFNWKDRKAIEYGIVYPKYKERNTIFIKRWFSFVIEMCIPAWVWGLSLIAAYIIEYWISVKEINIHAYVSIISSIILCIVSYMIHKFMAKEKSYIQLLGIMILILISLYALLIISLFYNNSLGIIFVGGVVSLMFSAVILVVDCLGLYQEYKYKYKWVRRSRLFRYIAIIICIFVFFYKISIGETDNLSFSSNVAIVIIYDWIVICYAEFLYLGKDSYRKFMEYKIAIDNDTIITTYRISQYSGNKVKVILNDGNVRIIDADKIDFIEYEVEYNKKSKLKKNVTCFFRNDMENVGLEFRGYKYIKDSWVSFYEIDKGVKKVRIININKIKEIFIEQLDKDNKKA